MLGLWTSMCLNFYWSMFETLQNSWKVPGLLKLVRFGVTNLTVPTGERFWRELQCGTLRSLIWTLHFHPRVKLHVWNINGSFWRQTGPHKLVVIQSRYNFSVQGLAPWFSVCLFVLVNVKECITFSMRDQICQMNNSFKFQSLGTKHFQWLF